MAEAPKLDAATDERAAAPTRARESFDELAFLSSIVGKARTGGVASRPRGPLVERRSSEPLLPPRWRVAQDERPRIAARRAREHAKRLAGERPLAANVSANSRSCCAPPATTEQAKTLKCNECGAMNYPTEWYCERCGAELAAL